MARKLVYLLVLAIFASSCVFTGQAPQNDPTTPISASPSEKPTDPSDAVAYSEEFIGGVKVLFAPDTSERSNNRLRRSIKQALDMLPEYMVKEIQQITIYAVNAADKCPPNVGLGRTAGCANSYDGWIEFIGGQSTYVALHEFGHIIGSMATPRGTTMYSVFFAEVYSKEPVSPTAYGRRSMLEDFAESFAIYFLDPSVLKNGYPLRYEFFKKLYEDKVR